VNPVGVSNFRDYSPCQYKLTNICKTN